jgi:hypothetical protein
VLDEHDDPAVESVAELPVREQAETAVTAAMGLAPPANPANPAESERRDFVLQEDHPYYTLLDKEKALLRPVVPKVDPARRKSALLNVYVNQNSDWASRQIVSSQSRRANFRRKTGHRCPHCGSQDTRLSATRGVADWFMFLFDYSLARCRNCDTKFRIWRSREEDDAAGDEKQLDPHPTE